MPPNVFEKRRDDDGHAPLRGPSSSRMPRPLRAERAGAVRVVDDERGVVAIADLDELAEVRLVAVERVDALDDHERVLALARLQDALEALGRVVVEEANLGRASLGTPAARNVPSRMHAWLYASRTSVVSLSASDDDRAEHRLVAGRERAGTSRSRTTSRGAARARRARSSSPAGASARGRTRTCRRRAWRPPSPSGDSSGRGSRSS